MKVANIKNVLIGLTLILAAWGGFVLKPTKHIVDTRPKIHLETMIPIRFADWKIDDQVAPVQVDPQRLAVLNKIYNQTLSRTYVNAQGDRMMLSIAYGGDQSDGMQVHKPEVCYPAQGFQMQDLAIGSFDSGYGVIPVKRMLATMGPRVEPLIYWITIGDTVAVNSLKWKIAQLKYGLTGKVPDGMIFRVSSIGDPLIARPLQEDFIKVLLANLTPENRKRIIGNTTL